MPHEMPIEKNRRTSSDCLQMWVTDWRQQIFMTDTMPPSPCREIFLEVAKNESHPAQIALRSETDFTVINVTVFDLVSGANVISADCVQTYFVGYVQVMKNTPNLRDPVREAPGWFPEKLLNVQTLSVEAKRTQPIWVRFRVPKNTAAGVYRGTVLIETDVSGEIRAPVSLNVYDVTLPEPEEGAFTLEMWNQLVRCFEEIGGDVDVIGKAYGIEAYSEEWWRLMETYAAFMKTNRLNGLFVNVVDLLRDAPETCVDRGGSGHYDWSLFDKFIELFLKNGGIKQICAEHLCAKAFDLTPAGLKVEILGDGRNTFLPYDRGGREYLDRYLPALYAHLAEKGWVSSFCQHICDEPAGGEMPRQYQEVRRQLAEHCPGVMTEDAIIGGNTTEYDMDRWIPATHTYEQLAPFFREKLREGKQLWLYTAMFPCGRYMNRFIDTQLYKAELLGWLCYKYDATGYLHWGLMEWNVWEPFDPQDNTVGTQNVRFPGDSWSIYPDTETMGIISSVRMEAMREAAEDYELFRLYERRDRCGARRLVDRVVADALHYAGSAQTAAEARRLLLKGAAGERVNIEILPEPPSDGKEAEPLPIRRGRPKSLNDAFEESEWTLDLPIRKECWGHGSVRADLGLLWDVDGLYAAFRIRGKKPINSHSLYCWDDDSVELYMDIDAAGGSYGADDRRCVQLTFRYDDAVVYIDGMPYDPKTHALAGDLIRHASTELPDGYAVEIGVPWAAFGRSDIGEGHILGITAQVNVKNSDDGTATVDAVLAYTLSDLGNQVSADGWPRFRLAADRDGSSCKK